MDCRGTLPRALGDRDLLQGAQADLPDSRLRGVQREGSQVAGVDRVPGPPAAEISGARLKVGAELLTPRGCRPVRSLGPPQHRRAAQDLWDGRRPGKGWNTRKNPVFAGRI